MSVKNHSLVKQALLCFLGLLSVLVVLVVPAAHASNLHAAILPNHVGTLVYEEARDTEYVFYATIINDSDITAENCSIALKEDLPFSLNFWTTDPTNNQRIGAVNTPVDITPRGAQSFQFTLELAADDYVPEQRMGFDFSCETHAAAVQVEGINDVLLGLGAPDLLLSIAATGPDNKLVFSTDLDGSKCEFTLRNDTRPSPCAVGAMALAMTNVSDGPLNLAVTIGAQASQRLLCRTTLDGECAEAIPGHSLLPFQLEPNESATFSAFLLSFRDNYFGFGSRPESAGFLVFEYDQQTSVRRDLISQITTEVNSPAFEWSATRSGDQIIVEGSIGVSSSCGMGVLEPIQLDDAPANQLTLRLRQAEGNPFEICLQAFGIKPVAWESEGSVSAIDTIVVQSEPVDAFFSNEPLTLIVE